MPGYYYRQRRNIRSRAMMARRIQKNWRKYRRYRKKRKPLYRRFKTLQRRVYNNLQDGWIDTNQSPISVDSVGVFKDICSLASINCNGTEHDNRIGNKIVVKKIQFKAQIKVAKDDPYNEFRMMLVQIDCPIIGTTPSIQDILEDSQITDVYSFYKKDSKIRFKILYDKTFQLSNADKDVGQAPAVTELAGCPYKNYIHLDKTWKFPKGIPVHYSGSGVPPQTGHVTKNMLWLLCVSDSTTTIITGSPTIGYNCRLSYDP